MSSRSKMASIEKRKRLEALYAKGKEVRFNTDGVNTGDPRDDDVVVWVAPPSPLQREMAIREAQGSRARAMLEARKESESDQYVVARSFLANLDHDALIDYMLEVGESDRIVAARRDVLMQKEWEDFNQLRDAMRQYEEAGSPEDDPEWDPLLERDRKFGAQVFERADEIREGDREGLALLPREELEKRALDKRIDNAGSSVFMKVYEDWMLFYACRDDEDHSVLFFDKIDELKSMPEEVQVALQDKLNEFVNDPAEAKNSPAVGSGSTSLQPPSEPETSPVSSPEESTELETVPGP